MQFPRIGGICHRCAAKGTTHVSVRCEDCDIVFANPMADGQELAAFYQGIYQSEKYVQQRYTDDILIKKSEIDALSNAALFKEAAYIFDYTKGGRFLDVGVGLGAVLLNVDRPEFELYVTEFDTDAIEFVRKTFRQPINAFHGDLLDAQYPDSYFDYICCNHVIEHVLDPVAYMREMYRILKPNGVLFLGTPNRKSNLYKLYRFLQFFKGTVPRIIDGIEHTFIFSPNNLATLAKDSGFSIELHRTITLRDSFRHIWKMAFPLKKRIARYVQTLFSVNQELICRKS